VFNALDHRLSDIPASGGIVLLDLFKIGRRLRSSTE
jgi:hypothetical protein